MKTWQRERGDSAAVRLFEHFTSSVANDWRLAQYDVRASQVHALALARAGIITTADAECLITALRQIANEITNGTLVPRDELEDIHTHVEVRLRALLGSLADMLHTGRSRNDQIATDLRLFVKEVSFQAIEGILALRKVLLKRARDCGDAVMPGYTHLQRAQPILIAHYLLAQAETLARDCGRYADSLARIDRCPLGSGALAGAGFPLDRDFMARELGFAGPTINSLDSVSDRDFIVEYLSDSAQLMAHLSRFAEDLIIWSTSEFAFVELPDELTSGSSMMPQKKNPDVLELVRGKAALVIGDLAAILTLLKGLPLSYNRDLQEGTFPLFRTADIVGPSLHILVPLVDRMRFNIDRLHVAAGNFALATDLADELVRHGVPFREAHHRVAALVARLLERGERLDAMTLANLQAELPELQSGSPHGEVEQREAQERPFLNPDASVRARQTQGSTNPTMVAAALSAAEKALEVETTLWHERARAFRAAVALQ
jgi:argininosuccinate lyase